MIQLHKKNDMFFQSSPDLLNLEALITSSRQKHDYGCGNIYIPEKHLITQAKL